MKNIYFLILFFCASQVANAQEAQTLESAPKIISSINPIYQIAKFISGDEKNNSLLIKPQFSEREYNVKSSDINKINETDVLFFVSSDLESSLSDNLTKISAKTKVVELIKAPNIKIISYDTRQGKINDPNIWLSTQNAKMIATQIASTLSDLYPQGASQYQKNLQDFNLQILEFEKNALENLAKIPQKSFVIDFDNLAYFTEQYGLNSAGIIRYDYDVEPTMRHIDNINKSIKKEKAVCVIQSSQGGSSLIAWQISNNNKIKLSLVDVIGKDSYKRKNGYLSMMEDLVISISKCINPDLKINKNY